MGLQTSVLKDMIAVVRAEEFRRAGRLSRMPPEVADDHWLFTDMPFVGELCLLLMVALWHQVEAELVGLAARAGSDGAEIKGQQYDEELRKLKKLRGRCWETVGERLDLQASGHKEMEALRRLANSYKHSPSMQPEDDLLKWLELDTEDTYATLPESQALQERLAGLVCLPKETTYCDIAERFVDVASNYLKEVEKLNRVKLGHVKRGLVPLNRFAR